MSKLFAFMIFALALTSCQKSNQMEEVAKENLESITRSWLDNRNDDNTILQELSIDNVQTIFANDSLCILSYNIAITHGGKHEETMLNLAMAKYQSDYGYIILYESGETTTPEEFRESIKAYKEEMKDEMTEEEVMQQITNSMYNTISKDGTIWVK